MNETNSLSPESIPCGCAWCGPFVVEFIPGDLCDPICPTCGESTDTWIGKTYSFFDYAEPQFAQYAGCNVFEIEE